MNRVDEVLARIAPGDRVLDVGGWACPFNRADWVIDCEPYETRGYYAKVGLPGSCGGAHESFTSESWVCRDICAHEPWPFSDKFFDFSVCSHTLEDVRDPLFVCSELIRVSKRGYIETPSRLAEMCRGWESERTAGLSHHRWLVDYSPGRLDFMMKWHLIHADRSLTFPPRLFYDLVRAEKLSHMFWEDRFSFAETVIHGRENQAALLRAFVAKVAADTRFQGIASDDPFEDESLREQLESTRAQLEESTARLTELAEIGPIALGLARRLHETSVRFPWASRLAKPLARLARPRRSA
jgi:hypothetical protein